MSDFRLGDLVRATGDSRGLDHRFDPTTVLKVVDAPGDGFYDCEPVDGSPAFWVHGGDLERVTA